MKKAIICTVSVILLIILTSCNKQNGTPSSSSSESKQTYKVVLSFPDDPEIDGKTYNLGYKEKYVFPVARKEHYSFNGWLVDGEKIDAIGNWKYQHDAVLVPSWTPKEYTITYKLSGVYDDASMAYNVESKSFYLPIPYLTSEYMFSGWTGDGITTPEKVVFVPSGSYGNKTYTANWIKREDIENLVNGFVIEVHDDHAEIVGYCGDYAESLTIPSEFNGLPVTTIADGAFYGLKNFVKTLVIPSSIVRIGDNAFGECSFDINITGSTLEEWKSVVVFGSGNGGFSNWNNNEN